MAYEFAAGKVCILVPSYRHAAYLPKRIETILGQTYRDFGLTIIDDCSPDDTAEVVGRYRSHPQVQAHTRKKNSGSPFSAWKDAAESADAEYLWIAESDDYASPDFLAEAVSRLEANRDGVLYYTHSWVIDEADLITGHSINYLRAQFPVIDWSVDQRIPGKEFNGRAQIYGNALPNMSSALIRLPAFRKAIARDFSRYKLAADWAFVGRLAAQGDVEFSARSDNFFRRHSQTARVQTQLERTCAEYWRAIAVVGTLGGVDRTVVKDSIMRCANMFIHEGGDPFKLVKESMRFGIGHNTQLAARMLTYLASDPMLLSHVRRVIELRKQRFGPV